MAELTTLRGIGKELEQKLKSVDISTVEELKKIGSKKTFVRLKLQNPSVCATYLYALEGAIAGIDFKHLPDATKQELKDFSKSFK